MQPSIITYQVNTCAICAGSGFGSTNDNGATISGSGNQGNAGTSGVQLSRDGQSDMWDDDSQDE